jgi:hypothetical protein
MGLGLGLVELSIKFSAAWNPTYFPNPETGDPRWPLDKYIHYEIGTHSSLSRAASQVALTEIFRAIFRQNNVRRAPGPQGGLKEFLRPGGFLIYMREDWGSLWPLPVTMREMWNEE